jgi:hypothetical protein
MSKLRGKEALLSWYDANTEDTTEPKSYWAIYSDEKQAATKGNHWLKSSDESNLSYSKARVALERVIDKMMVSDARYYIVLRTSPNEATKQAQTEYVHPYDTNIAISGISEPMDIEARIAEGIAKYEEKKEKEALLKRIDELEKANKNLEKEATPEWMNKIGTIVSGFIENPAIVNGLMGTTKPNQTMKAVGNVQSSKSNVQSETQEQSRLENALEKLSNADPDFLEGLEKLAQMAEQMPANYKMAKNMLL